MIVIMMMGDITNILTIMINTIEIHTINKICHDNNTKDHKQMKEMIIIKEKVMLN